MRRVSLASDHSRIGALLLVFTLIGGCSETVDTIAAEPNSDEGGVTQGDGTSMSNGTATAGTDDATSDSATGADTQGSDGTGTATGGGPNTCDQLDVLLVVDNTADNRDVLDALLNDLEPLDELWRDPTYPFADDFHVGVVPTQDIQGEDACRLSGTMTDTPQVTEGPCETAAEGPWASAADDNSAAVLMCLGALGDAIDDARTVAQAVGRGLSSSLSADVEGPTVATACNEGFSRPDALTLVIIIAAGDDAGMLGDPASWREELLEEGAAEIVLSMHPLSLEPGCSGPANDLMAWLSDDDPYTVEIDWCTSRDDPSAALVSELASLLDDYCS